jgi:hypothetical protein
MCLSLPAKIVLGSHEKIYFLVWVKDKVVPVLN